MSNIEILSTANDWVNEGHKVALATVLKTWGSAPRRAGSQLAIRNDGHMVGSVSGGCVEGDVVANALELELWALDIVPGDRAQIILRFFHKKNFFLMKF